MDYLVSLAVFMGIWVVLALSLNILMGYAGQVSLGQAAFFGIGAYTSAIFALRFHQPFAVGFVHGSQLVEERHRNDRRRSG